MEGKGQSETANAASLRALMSRLAQNTGMHGVPNIQRSSNWTRKITWMLVVMTGLGMLSWKLSEAFIKFYSYPVKTEIGYYAVPELVFPAVTICNMNPVKSSSLTSWKDTGQNSPRDLLRNLLVKGEASSLTDPFPDAMASNQTTTNSTQTSRRSLSMVQQYLKYVAQMDESELYSIGYTIEEMLMGCTFDGVECSVQNITQFYNSLHGNCYILNLDSGMRSSNGGPLYGLELQLFVGQDDYLTFLTKAAGFRVAIHNQTTMPFPEDAGFSVLPGTRTSIGIRKVLYERTKPPHGHCETFTAAGNRKINVYTDYIPSIGYSMTACMKTCYQTGLLKSCSCFDASYPYGKNITALQQFSKKQYRPCEETEKCRRTILKQYVSGHLKCNERCPEECVSTEYNRHISEAMYPSKKGVVKAYSGMPMECFSELYDALVRSILDNGPPYENAVVGDVARFSKKLKHSMDKMKPAARKEFVQENVALLQIYFEDLVYEYVKTSPSYESLDLFSDLGGQAGFWLGLSIIALFEVIELLVDLGLTFYGKATKRTKVTDSRDSLTNNPKTNVSTDVIEEFSLSVVAPNPS